ncbi:MAG: PBP superfamily domain protein [Syntrophorhabdus sp. PtaU1.Bin058]|nr:MAG: PBP superfamily domain protein [Syntrophorhabdus sp. PtaU1.Bin058]
MEIISAKELAGYLRINEKKLYRLVQESKIPHLKIGGKIAFAREVIDRWILESTEREKVILIAGSDDPLLRKIIDIYNNGKAGTIFYAPIGSINGLKMLKGNAATMSCVHILDLEKRAYTLSYMDRYLSATGYVVMNLFFREQGLFIKKDNPKGIHSLKDIAGDNVYCINRNQGSGTRLLFDFLIGEERIVPDRIKGYTQEVGSHMEAGLQVLKGAADCAFGIRYIANILNLDFLPLFQERFDMVIPEDHFHSIQTKSFLSFFEQQHLLNSINDLTGYDVSNTGSILYPPQPPGKRPDGR